jgi:putative hydrolase of the HAD superfamily
MSYTTVFFDLDDTLYPHDNGLWQAIRGRMGRYMAEKLGLPEQEIPALRRMYFETYGTTLRGLQKHYQVNADDYLAYVHDLPLEDYLKPQPALHVVLASLPEKRFIFTNADADHAGRVLSIIGIQDCFEGIIDVKALEFTCKPEPAAYQRALQISGNPDPHSCVMIDDSVINLAPARELGITTVLVKNEQASNPAICYTIASVLELRQALPQLWNKQAEQPVRKRDSHAYG